MGGHEPGVARDAVDEGGIAAVQELQAQHVKFQGVRPNLFFQFVLAWILPIEKMNAIIKLAALNGQLQDLVNDLANRSVKTGR